MQKHLHVLLRMVCRVAHQPISHPGVGRTRSHECSTKHQRVVMRWASSTQVFCPNLVTTSCFSVLSWSCVFFLLLRLFLWTVSLFPESNRNLRRNWLWSPRDDHLRTQCCRAEVVGTELQGKPTLALRTICHEYIICFTWSCYAPIPGHF
jgi:hypothetical protein